MVLRSCSYSEGDLFFPSQVPEVEFQNRAVCGKCENNPNMVLIKNHAILAKVTLSPSLSTSAFIFFSFLSMPLIVLDTAT